ncbi:cytochrome ubiquinol oxidase subunit I [Pseudovibrio sp. Tun.PSC04-5.I4]|uniref:cytochrome ubiquinol oxidase subunit I n=1 Tax=Pseudovibrio sp. Tun.PSC04-5.I4 TaxID=1798213 RepID=UPI000887D628|nr:cytochrome ubiquinol oxidase subunit I [Pseudovibrio sp. Tun.PSC04-5.I4]SDQ77126.1 cytochrome bd-I ubiquinol oxidase subunit 1 apoprotein [Pseudovibrio sp. Tun.PSC04-5.I4]
MDSLAIDLARFQFAFTIAFHIMFPAFTIGLASFLAVLEGLWLWSGRDVYLRVFKFWLVIFALTFAMGVVSGIVMAYQFGTNWSAFSDKTGSIIGPLMGYEVLTAFFLEAGFLGIMLFGMKKVGKKLHFLATVTVAFGTAISAFWIISVNSWMQTPTGYAINEVGQFVPEDWFEIVFNPSFPYRLVHMVMAAYLTTAFVVGAVGAYHLLRNRFSEGAQVMFSMAMWLIIVVTPIQIFAGDLHGLNTLEYQPAKIAAMEGHFESQGPAPLILFGWPDVEAGVTRYKVEVPYLSSIILTHSLDGVVPGLNDFPKEDWPPAAIVFVSFRIMVGIGMLMLLVGVWGLWSRARGKLYESEWLQRAAILMGPAGFVAVIAGWTTTEVGRQPFTVYGLLRTVDSASPIEAPAVWASLVLFVAVYCIVFGVGIYYIFRSMAKSPDASQGPEEGIPVRTAGITPAQALQSKKGDHSDDA